MAAHIWIEEDSGTYQGHRHPHNGYYAGDFSANAPRDLAGEDTTRALGGSAG